MNFLHIDEAKYLKVHKVWVRFNDGTEGTVDLGESLEGAVFEPLKDPDYFGCFQLEGHTLAWPNGADFAPEFVKSVLSS